MEGALSSAEINDQWGGPKSAAVTTNVTTFEQTQRWIGPPKLRRTATHTLEARCAYAQHPCASTHSHVYSRRPLTSTHDARSRPLMVVYLNTR